MAQSSSSLPIKSPKTWEESIKRISQKRQKPRQNEGFLGANSVVTVPKDNGSPRLGKETAKNGGSRGGFGVEEEKK